MPATELCRLVLPKVSEKVESGDHLALEMEGAKNEHPYHAYQMETEDLVALNSILRKLRVRTCVVYAHVCLYSCAILREILQSSQISFLWKK